MSSQNNTPQGWMETALGEIVEFGNDKISISKIGIDNYISTENILTDRKGIVNATSLPTLSTVNKFIVGDTLFSNIRTYFKKVWFANKIGGSSNDVIIFRPKNRDLLFDKFLYYYISSDKFIDFTVKSAKGTKMPRGDKNAMSSLETLLPPFPEQKSIAAILTSFDDKIELLQAQNKTLEETAQTIFKEWFGKYQIGDELPEGWRVEELGNLLELIIDYRGKTPLKLGLDWSETGIPAISAKSIKNGKIVRRDAMNFGSEELYSIWMKDELKKGDILLTSEAPLGEMYYINNLTKYILSQRVFALRTNLEITSEYLFHYLFSTNGQALLQARASGSTVEGIRQSELRKIDVIVPKKDILDSASKIFKSFFDKIFTNEQQIQSLTQTRDELLPKLMSGEVRVNEFK